MGTSLRLLVESLGKNARRMGRADEGLLEAGYWEPAKPTPSPSLLTYAQVLFQFVRPSFLSKAGPRSTKLRRTAYLDGLRGFAALLVYFGHHELWAHKAQHADQILENAFGYETRYYMVTLPGVRTFFSGGHLAVSCFFVISGYVLSAKPLALIQSGDRAAFSDNISSALFRRWLRLYLPVICTTFLTFSMWHAFGVLANFQPQRNFRDELWNWYIEFKSFSFIFRLGGEPWLSYNFHVWSIPEEFKGSVVIYTALVSFSKCTRTARLWGETALVYYFMWIVDGAHMSMFMVGMLLCDLDLLAIGDDLPLWLKRLKPYNAYFFPCLFALGILLGGCPAFSWDIQVLRSSPGWRHISFLVPQAVFDYKWFFLFWAATFVVASAPRLPCLKRFFESRFCLYLGRISFAFYLVHGPILWTLGDRLYAATGWTQESHALGIPDWVNKFPLPRWGPFGMEISFLLPHLILLPVTLWMAEIATTLFDEPSIKFSSWIYRKVTKSEPGKL